MWSIFWIGWGASLPPPASFSLSLTHPPTPLKPNASGACDQPNKYHFCSPKGGSCVSTPEGQDVCTFAWLYGDGSSASGLLLTSKVGVGSLMMCIYVSVYLYSLSGVYMSNPIHPPRDHNTTRDTAT